MALPKRKPEEKITYNQALRVVHKLSPETRTKLIEQLKFEELRRDIQIGIDQADRGELFSEEEVLAHLKACRDKVIKKQSK